MESPQRQDATGELNGVALAAFVLGISSVSGLVGSTFFSSFAQDGWLFTISLIPAAAALLCAQIVRQTGGAAARGASFAVAGAILAVVGALTNTLNYLRIQNLDSPFG